MSETTYIERYWRDARPEDAIKDPPMVARFKYYPDGFPGNWEIAIDLLSGLSRSIAGTVVEWFDSSGNRFINAQVYDAPDPGEGWRLIDPDKDSYQQDGIEYQEKWQAKWHQRDELSWTPFSPKTFYRIRITPTVTYVPFTWEDRDQLRGRWVAHDNQELQLVNLDNSDGFHANDVHVDNLCKYWKFLDTGKPVGKEVTQ